MFSRHTAALLTLVVLVGVGGIALTIWRAQTPAALVYGPDSTIYDGPLLENGAIDYTAHLDPADRFNRTIHRVTSFVSESGLRRWSEFSREAPEGTPAFQLRDSEHRELRYSELGRAALRQWGSAVKPEKLAEYFPILTSFGPDEVAAVSSTAAFEAGGHPYFTKDIPLEQAQEVVEFLLSRARTGDPEHAATLVGHSLEIARAVRRYAQINWAIGLELEQLVWSELSFWPQIAPQRLGTIATAVIRYDREISAFPQARILQEGRLEFLHIILDSYAKRDGSSLVDGRLSYDAHVQELLGLVVQTSRQLDPLIESLRDPAELSHEIAALSLPDRDESIAAAVMGVPGDNAKAFNRGALSIAGHRWATLSLLRHLAGEPPLDAPPFGDSSIIETATGPQWRFKIEGTEKDIRSPDSPERYRQSSGIKK